MPSLTSLAGNKFNIANHDIDQELNNMAKRVNFNHLHNKKRSKTEFLAIVMDKCPELTKTDCNIGRGYGIITFCTTDTLEPLFTKSVKKELNKVHIEAIPPKKLYVKRRIFVSNIKPFITKLTPVQLLKSFNESYGDWKQ